MAGVRSVEGWVCGLKRPKLGQPRARKDGPAGRQQRRWRGSSVAAASVLQVRGFMQVGYDSVIAPVGSAQYMQFAKRSVQKPCAVLDGSERLGVHASALHLS